MLTEKSDGDGGGLIPACAGTTEGVLSRQVRRPAAIDKVPALYQ